MSDIPPQDTIDSLLQKVKKADDTLQDALAMAETVVAEQKDYISTREKLTATEEMVCILKKRLDESEYERTMQNQELRALKEEYQKLVEINETEKQKSIKYNKCFWDLKLANEETVKYKDSKIQYLENKTFNLEQKIESLEKALKDQNSKIRTTTELENIRRDLNIAQYQLSQAKHFAERNTDTNQGGSEENHRVAPPRNVRMEKYEEMKKRCETAELSVQSKYQELERHKTDIETKEKQIKELQKSITELEVELKETHDRAEETMKGTGKVGKRYSALAGSKLTDGNANIAELSDENRPTKLAEKYSELYENEWTKAFYGFTKDGTRTEDTACHILAHAFCIIYSACRKEADDDMQTLINATKSFYKVDNLPKEMVIAAKDRRKTNPQAGSNSKTNKKLCGDEMRKILSADEQTRVSEYLQKSIELCWLMAVQDPPVFVDTNLSQRDQRFNTAVYKPYTKTGEYIDFIVWPTLFLHEGGSVLCKGIAQGMISRKRNQPYDNVEIIHKTPNTDVKVSQVPVSYPVSGSLTVTSNVHTNAFVNAYPAGRGNAKGTQLITRTVHLAAPQETVLKGRLNQLRDSSRKEPRKNAPCSEQKKYVTRINITSATKE